MVANNESIQPKIRRIQHNWPEVDDAALVSDFGAEAAARLALSGRLGQSITQPTISRSRGRRNGSEKRQKCKSQYSF